MQEHTANNTRRADTRSRRMLSTPLTRPAEAMATAPPPLDQHFHAVTASAARNSAVIVGSDSAPRGPSQAPVSAAGAGEPPVNPSESGTVDMGAPIHRGGLESDGEAHSSMSATCRSGDSSTDKGEQDADTTSRDGVVQGASQ